jgi:hypothetical protein
MRLQQTSVLVGWEIEMQQKKRLLLGSRQNIVQSKRHAKSRVDEKRQ